MMRYHVVTLAVVIGLGVYSVMPGWADGPRESAAATSTTAFTCDLFSKLRGKQGNLFFSPLSISAALTMTSGGAANDTLTEMTKVLNLPVDPAAAQAEIGNLLKRIAKAESPGLELNIANAIWTQKDLAVKPKFMELLKQNFNTETQAADFSNPQAARQAINGWVEKQTRDKIKDLFPEGVINPLTRMVLVNAVYFKSDWATPFVKEMTKDEPFTLLDGKKVNVPMMNQTGSFAFSEGDSWQALELPYKGNRFSMVVVVPKKENGLPAIEEQVTAENIAMVLKSLRGERVAVSLPRFKSTGEFNLNATLSEMGMKKAFDPNSADFSGISDSEKMFIQAVVHKSFVDVNEKGSEAAAATGVAVGVRSMAPGGPPKVFKADHPFLYFIRDNASDAILFFGRYAQP